VVQRGLASTPAREEGLYLPLLGVRALWLVRNTMRCPKCRKHTYTISRLFDLLRDFPKSVPKCSCGESQELRLVPPFALGAGGRCFKVLDAFHASSRWKSKNKQITFCPFLVVLKTTDGSTKKLWYWLPYWHVIQSKKLLKTKFGERAPWMGATMFDGLLAQAHAKGYINLLRP
jgi:hypothetical protein